MFSSFPNVGVYLLGRELSHPPPRSGVTWAPPERGFEEKFGINFAPPFRRTTPSPPIDAKTGIADAVILGFSCRYIYFNVTLRVVRQHIKKLSVSGPWVFFRCSPPSFSSTAPKGKNGWLQMLKSAIWSLPRGRSSCTCPASANRTAPRDPGWQWLRTRRHGALWRRLSEPR